MFPCRILGQCSRVVRFQLKIGTTALAEGKGAIESRDECSQAWMLDFATKPAHLEAHCGRCLQLSPQTSRKRVLTHQPRLSQASSRAP